MSFGMRSPLWGENLVRMMRSPKANPFPDVIGTFMGRDAIALAVSWLGLGPDDVVVLPAYHCREVVKPFAGKTHVEFYDVSPDLTVDPEEIERRVQDSRVKMLLIINYFGFLQPHRREIKEIASDRGILLVEDCAHSLLSAGSGETGDLSIYSFRKILPVTDGGGLKIGVHGRTGAAHFYPQIYSDILSILAITKSLLNVKSATLSRAGMSSRMAAPLARGEKGERVLPLSSFARNGIGSAHFPDIIRKRRSDYQFWQEFGEKTGLFTPIFRSLPSGVCPLGFPAKVRDRADLKAALEKRGIAVTVHWTLPETIGREFCNSHDLSAHMLTLPVYPELRPKDHAGLDGSKGLGA